MKKIFARAIAGALATSMVLSGCSLQRISELDEKAPVVESDESEYRNEYFPYKDSMNLEYSVIKLFEEDASVVPVNVELLDTYEEGDVYRITIEYEDVPERYYWGVTDRYNLGTFYVTDNTIYVLDEREDTPTEEEFLSSGLVVCADEDSQQDINGEEITLKHEGDDCIFSRHNTLIESGYYISYRWVKGKGLAYIRSGYGAEGDPIEISLQ